MKIKLCIMIFLPILLLGCSDSSDNSNNSVVNKALEDGITKSETNPQVGDIIDLNEINDNISIDAEKDFSTIANIQTDINILEMSTTLAYSQVIRMMSNPESYWGKTIKVSGTYIKQSMAGFPDLHFLLLLDETNCCQGFLELVLPSDITPPQDGSLIAVAGEYDFFSDSTGEYSAILVTDYLI